MSPPDYVACAPTDTSPASTTSQMDLGSKHRSSPNAETNSPQPSSPESEDYNHLKQSRHDIRSARPFPNVDDRPHSQAHHGALQTPANRNEDMLAQGRREGLETHCSSHKKKGKPQRFYCDEYPPCSLSFTRSEHLARHIRKHTGERPFVCHCSRRFSRLDNLRQHAQTVHQNENIPQDSLAAMGTRYQRQVPIERARVQGNRTRGHTTSSSQSGPIRRHTRNSLSTSSTSSINSAFGAQGISDQRRPAPLVMLTNVDRIPCSPEWTTRPTTPATPQFNLPSPNNNYHTSISAMSCNGPGTPPWTPATISPHCMSYPLQLNRPTDKYTHDRRMSVPNTSSSISSSPSKPPGAMPKLSFTSSAQPTFQKSATNKSVSDAEFRRRTWHPDSSASMISRGYETMASISHVPDESFQPSHLFQNDASVAPTMRLPGIESFDSLRDPPTPPRRDSNSFMNLNPDVRSSWPISPLNLSSTRYASHGFSRGGPLHELQDTGDWEAPRTELGGSINCSNEGKRLKTSLHKELPSPTSIGRVTHRHPINEKIPILKNHATSWPTDSVQSNPNFPSWIRSVVQKPLISAEANGLASRNTQEPCTPTNDYYSNNYCVNNWTANHHGTVAISGDYGRSNPYPPLPTPEPCANVTPPFPHQKNSRNTGTDTIRLDALVAAASL
ncbi:BgtA-20852 [Blumeria graminis f. sp. tritici]|uniref:BgtA-20852 n=2 Tax=Blumeria graminis f. sp. tritici TaxID=62690 RepID=A0A9X9QF91_BLUGR|nr:hypothetical protein BGT96224_A20852 [Blumeria graminis f. sp. tritici 96224]VDB92976.1 BgtA-20852 [Blumeria graminis f. sp. tritici]